MKKPLLILAGPTASGKTQTAIELSKLIPSELISCDSMQVYRGMPITTQAPTKPQLKALPMHLVSFLSPSKEYNANFFRKDALSQIHKMHKKKRLPLICGGTGLYVRALLDGLFEADSKLPTRDEAFRQELLKEQEVSGGDFLHEKLKKVDPDSAKKIHPNDFRRLIRALEVFHLTGQPFSTQKSNRKGVRDDFNCRIFFLNRKRQDLYNRINARVDEMIAQGLVEEIQKLSKKKLSLTAQMALGVREIQGYLAGKYSLAEAGEDLKTHTRHYAKRQISWFKYEKDVEFVEVDAHDTPKVIAQRIAARLKGFK